MLCVCMVFLFLSDCTQLIFPEFVLLKKKRFIVQAVQVISSNADKLLSDTPNGFSGTI